MGLFKFGASTAVAKFQTASAEVDRLIIALREPASEALELEAKLSESENQFYAAIESGSVSRIRDATSRFLDLSSKRAGAVAVANKFYNGEPERRSRMVLKLRPLFLAACDEVESSLTRRAAEVEAADARQSEELERTVVSSALLEEIAYRLSHVKGARAKFDAGNASEAKGLLSQAVNLPF